MRMCPVGSQLSMRSIASISRLSSRATAPSCMIEPASRRLAIIFAGSRKRCAMRRIAGSTCRNDLAACRWCNPSIGVRSVTCTLKSNLRHCRRCQTNLECLGGMLARAAVRDAIQLLPKPFNSAEAVGRNAVIPGACLPPFRGAEVSITRHRTHGLGQCRQLPIHAAVIA